MKHFALKLVACIVLAFVMVVACIHLIIYKCTPEYEVGKYKMVYRVYYPNNTREYVIENDLPISLNSFRGTNSIKKTVRDKWMFATMYYDARVFETTVPIEVVEYTYAK